MSEWKKTNIKFSSFFFLKNEKDKKKHISSSFRFRTIFSFCEWFGSSFPENAIYLVLILPSVTHIFTITIQLQGEREQLCQLVNKFFTLSRLSRIIYDLLEIKYLKEQMSY